jgi:hypothetical protein
LYAAVNIPNSYGTQLGQIRGARESARQYLVHCLLDVDEYKQIAELQEERLKDGYEQYEFQMWQYDDARLLYETYQELADALNYLGAMLGRNEGNS